MRNEINFLETRPPSELITIQDLMVVRTLGERLSYFEEHAYGNPSQLPDEVYRKIMDKVKATLDLNKEIRKRRVEQMAIWRLPQ